MFKLRNLAPLDHPANGYPLFFTKVYHAGAGEHAVGLQSTQKLKTLCLTHSAILGTFNLRVLKKVAT